MSNKVILKAFVIVTAACAADALLLTRGTLCMLLLIFGTITYVARTVRALLSGGQWRVKAVIAAFCVVVPACTLTVLRADHDMAAVRARELVNRIEAYRASYGNYPETLAELVPRFYASLPRAHIGFQYNEFHYSASGGSPLLWYYVTPPYLRRVYDFGKREWRLMD